MTNNNEFNFQTETSSQQEKLNQQQEIYQILGFDPPQLNKTEELPVASLVDDRAEVAEEANANRVRLAKKGSIQAGIISIFVGSLALAGGAFFTLAFQNKEDGVEVAKNKEQKPLDEIDTSSDNADEIGKLKTNLALYEQDAQLKKLAERDNLKTDLVAVKPKQRVEKTLPSPRIREDEPLRTYSPPPPQESAQAFIPTQEPKAVETEPIDPIHQWQQLAKMGNYGKNLPDKELFEDKESESLLASNAVNDLNNNAIENNDMENNVRVDREVPVIPRAIPRVSDRAYTFSPISSTSSISTSELLESKQQQQFSEEENADLIEENREDESATKIESNSNLEANLDELPSATKAQLLASRGNSAKNPWIAKVFNLQKQAVTRSTSTTNIQTATEDRSLNKSSATNNELKKAEGSSERGNTRLAIGEGAKPITDDKVLS